MITAAAAVLVTGLAACGSSGSTASSGGTPTAATAATCTNSGVQKDLYAKGALTVATDKPAYPPWFEDNNPRERQGL